MVPELELDLLQRATELERHLRVILIDDWCSCVLTDVETFVQRKPERAGILNATFHDLLAINGQCSPAAFTNPATVVGEVEGYSVLARHELLTAGDARLALLLVGILIPVLICEGVSKHRFAIEHEKTPTAEPSTLSHKDTVGPTFRNLHISGDVERLVLYIWGVRFRDANHTWVVRKLRPSGVEAGTECWVRPVGETGIDRQHVVLCCFAQKEIFQFGELLGILLRQVGRLAKVLGHVVEFPWEVVRIRLHA